MRISVMASMLLLLGACAGCGEATGGSQSAGDLRVEQAELEADLLLNKVEQGAASYRVAKSQQKAATEDNALLEVQHAAHSCWEFGIEECSTMPQIEDIVDTLESEAHRRIPFTPRAS